MSHAVSPRFTTALAVEAVKLRRSLALLLAAVAPLLIAVFVFFNLLRVDKPMPWAITLQTSAAIWAFFMLPMSVTALTALVAHTEHGPRAWDHLRALPLPRWHLYASKATCVLGVVAAMSLLLALLTLLAVEAAALLKPAIAPLGAPDIAGHITLLGRIFLAAWLLVAVQLWIALRYASFVPALAVGIGGTFFAVVATSAKVGAILPWQIPVNQLASDPLRVQLTLLLGCIGGCAVFAAMLWQLSRREVLA
ncbi:MAG TPA: ABC transporter permease [Thermomonas sp.]|nr:ABC transporter permease [Thermomonas sp.]